jgi:hypothetical protein
MYSVLALFKTKTYEWRGPLTDKLLPEILFAGYF